ncbi:hypothetical protein ACSG3M_001363 [Vibrio vulnificus]|uniref:hypothetical protein n=1 Tax=Vibrio vulnificus TaxID=672 RepID=UPI001EEBD45A|nr:hypothetical protein [Vibrio vulnificus]MCG6274311.1 hypothetical protein [Vibrio vulnificus]
MSGLTIRDRNVFGFCQVPKKDSEFQKARLPMAGLDVIFMRANPPLDNLALTFLDAIKDVH